MCQLVCNFYSVGGKSWPVTGVLQDMTIEFVQDRISFCVLRVVACYDVLLDVAVGLLPFFFTGCRNWHVATCVLRDVFAGLLLL